MARSNLDKLMNLLAAIRTRDTKKALELTDLQFIQHAPDIADGVEGLKQYIVDSPPNRLQMSAVRVIEDGPFVVAQLKSEDSGENSFAVFDFREVWSRNSGYSRLRMPRPIRADTRS